MPSSASAVPSDREPALLDGLSERNRAFLGSALGAFARGGYFGTSTVEIAASAGVSQPYVVQSFGGKERLFIAVHQLAGERMLDAFRAVIAAGIPVDTTELGRAYRDLVIEDADALMVIQHAFAAARVPAIASEARRLFAVFYELLSSAGIGQLELREFMGRGMLINALLAVDVPGYAAELGLSDYLDVVFGS